MSVQFDGVESFPLSWPVGWQRTPAYKRQSATFTVKSSSGNRRHTIAEGTDFVMAEIGRMGARNLVISTNIALRQDGLPRSGQKRPDDPGVAVYFLLKKEPKVLACDRWTTPEDNLWAIGKHIEALRGQERWGVGTIDQAFAGYPALPTPAQAWSTVLRVPPAASAATITAAYRALVKQHHPDAGGDPEEFLKIQTAYEEALKAKEKTE